MNNLCETFFDHACIAATTIINEGCRYFTPKDREHRKNTHLNCKHLAFSIYCENGEEITASMKSKGWIRWGK